VGGGADLSVNDFSLGWSATTPAPSAATVDSMGFLKVFTLRHSNLSKGSLMQILPTDFSPRYPMIVPFPIKPTS